MSLKSKANLRKTTKGNLQKSKKMGANKSKKNSFRSNKNKGKNQKRLSKSKKRYSKSNQKGGRYDFFFPRDRRNYLDDKKFNDAWDEWSQNFVVIARLIKGNIDMKQIDSNGDDYEAFKWKNFDYPDPNRHEVPAFDNFIREFNYHKTSPPTWYRFSFSREKDRFSFSRAFSREKATGETDWRYIWVLDQKDQLRIDSSTGKKKPGIPYEYTYPRYLIWLPEIREYSSNLSDDKFQQYLNQYTGEGRPVRIILITNDENYYPLGAHEKESVTPTRVPPPLPPREPPREEPPREEPEYPPLPPAPPSHPPEA